MASNVIVEDESGNPITYQDVSTVSLDTEDGGTAVFVNANDIPEQMQADMAQTDATAVDFVKNQYFGVLPDNFKAQELTFEPSPDTDKLYYVKGFSVGVPLVIGQTYKVTWGDTEYELVAKDMADIKNTWNTTFPSDPYLGNSYFTGLEFGSEEWGENTGEPFYINNQWCCTNDLTVTARIVGIRLAENTKKLDSQWLPDGLATEAFVEEKIAAIEIPEGGGGSASTVSWNDLADKPFGGKNIHIFVDHSTVDTSVMFSSDEIGATFVKLSDETLSKDEFIGVTFEASFPDETTKSAIVSEEDLTIEYDKGFCFTVMGQVPVWTCFEAGEHTISADGASTTFTVPEAGTYVIDFAVAELAWSQMTKNTLKYLDNKYLDFMGAVPESQEFVAETKETSELVTMGEVSAFCNTLPLSAEQYELWFQNRRSVTVRYDNVEHILEPQLLDPFGSGEDGVGVGNLEGFGGTGNGESFAMAGMYSQVVGSGAINYYILCASLVDTEPTEHTIAIYLQVETQKIKEDYIPAIPEFDLTAMGLPTVPVDGSSVNVSGIDLTEMKNAIAKGLVKIKVDLDGISIEHMAAFSRIAGGDSYVCGGFFAIDGTPVAVSVSVYGDVIVAQAIPLIAAV